MSPIREPGQAPVQDDPFDSWPGVSASFRSFGITAGRRARPHVSTTSHWMTWLTALLSAGTLGALASGWMLWHARASVPQTWPPRPDRRWFSFFDHSRWLGPTETTVLLVHESSYKPPVRPDFVGPPTQPRELIAIRRVKVFCAPWAPLPNRLGDLSSAAERKP